ncbi:MAG: RagB/SusD family nutrient uptake outer membrane protein, partial [Candidatus Cryptobacteroides sp.]
MKPARYIIIAAAAILFSTSCINLDLNPLDKPSTGNWYQDKDQIIMSLNNIQLVQFWLTDRTEAGLTADLDELTDDSVNRNSQNPFKSGTLTGDNSVLVKTIWSYTYKGISRCNAILDNMYKAKDTMSEEDYRMLEGCARFYRACFYSRICQLFGDPVFFLDDITLEVAYSTGRTPLLEALPKIMEDFDYAIENCPATYTGQQLVTKGAALGMKARTALYFGTLFKFQDNPDAANSQKYLTIARDASKACIDLNVYDLYPDFAELFLNKTHNTCEAVFSIARSYEYSGGNDNQYLHNLGVTAGLPRMHGGYCSKNPTWDLLWAFTCNDGLPIDKSPRYNPKNPWENR